MGFKRKKRMMRNLSGLQLECGRATELFAEWANCCIPQNYLLGLLLGWRWGRWVPVPYSTLRVTRLRAVMDLGPIGNLIASMI